MTSNTLARFPFFFTSRSISISTSKIHIYMTKIHIHMTTIDTGHGYNHKMNSNPFFDCIYLSIGGWKKDSSFVQSQTGWMEQTRWWSTPKNKVRLLLLFLHTKKQKMTHQIGTRVRSGLLCFSFPNFTRVCSVFFKVGFPRFCVFPKLKFYLFHDFIIFFSIFVFVFWVGPNEQAIHQSTLG